MWTCVNDVCSWCPQCNVSSLLLRCSSWALWTPCSTMFWQSVTLAALSAVCNGSFSAFAKSPKVRQAQVPGYIFNLWICVGICLASTPIALGTNLRCVGWQGFLSGLLFVLSTAASMTAIMYIGLYQAVGIGCGTAALVSFVFGAAVEQGSISNLPQALLGITCLLIGITAVAAAGVQQQAITAKQQEHQQFLHQFDHQQQHRSAWHDNAEEYHPPAGAAWLQQPLLDDEEEQDSSDTAAARASISSAIQYSMDGVSSQSAAVPQPKLLGLLFAVVTGVFGGLILGPMDYVGHECRGLPYQAALAVGVLVTAPVVTYCLHWCIKGKVTITLPIQAEASAVPGILAGIIWTVGVCSNMLAVAGIGLAVAYPIMQAGLFIAGLLGIVLFGELRSLLPQLIYWSGGVLLAVGAVVVTRAGQA